jgi:phenylpropionate dioxygenase-like ring-hydroxylating dioxygenase large terminal subunit
MHPRPSAHARPCAQASAGKGEWPQRRLVPAPVVEEAGGFVWIFNGPPGLPADERPPIPATLVPELGDPGWKAVYGEIAFECNHAGVFENAIDMVRGSMPGWQ